MRGWRAWFSGAPPMLTAQLAQFRAETADLPKPRVIYALPNRDKTHAWGENDALVEAQAAKVTTFGRRHK